MAQLQTTAVTGSYAVGQVPSVARAGIIWYNGGLCRLQYSFCNGVSIVCCTL